MPDGKPTVLVTRAEEFNRFVEGMTSVVSSGCCTDRMSSRPSSVRGRDITRHRRVDDAYE
jgi:hypothetical protein